MAADDVCEHHYETRILGGRPLTVRACVFCRTPDWADLDEQAAELYRWGWQEGRAGAAARDTLSAYDRPPAGEQSVGLTPCTCRQAVHGREHRRATVPGCSWCAAKPDNQPSEQSVRTTRNNALTSDNTLHELRTWLATERGKAQAADRPDCDPAFLVTPHNGIAAGLAIALAWVNHRLGEALDSGPSVAECRADDRAWPLQKAGE
jgi:hypothetical protein